MNYSSFFAPGFGNLPISCNSLTMRTPQFLPPQEPVPAPVRSLILGMVSQPSLIASFIVLREMLRQVQTLVYLSKILSGTFCSSKSIALPPILLSIAFCTYTYT
nr:MAG TPA: hypothetical protein [Herelleviridae sp.]